MNTHVPTRGVAASSRHWAGWPLERVLFAMAGTVTLASAALAALISPWWLLLAAFVGINQLAFVVVGDCVASLVLRRVFGLERGGSLMSAAPLQLGPVGRLGRYAATHTRARRDRLDRPRGRARIPRAARRDRALRRGLGGHRARNPSLPAP